jgi:hypothetical protein
MEGVQLFHRLARGTGIAVQVLDRVVEEDEVFILVALHQMKHRGQNVFMTTRWLKIHGSI